MTNVHVVVVTYNRRALLETCLLALARQTLRPKRIFVLDNASTDGTAQWLSQWLPKNLPNGELIALDENSGGAGGFSFGLQKALSEEGDWVWMMDDDAEPYTTALDELMKIADCPKNIYGSLATNGGDTSWTTTILDSPVRITDKAAEVPSKARTLSLPFLGFLVHRQLVDVIGLPDSGFFIAADDIEYCLRAEHAGAKIFVAGRSRIEHPKAQRNIIKLPTGNLVYLKLPPWKRYYDTRNRILIARKYYGMKLLTHTLPGSFARLVVALIREPNRLLQLWAFLAGIVDGLLGLKGCRHSQWRIRQ